MVGPPTTTTTHFILFSYCLHSTLCVCDCLNLPREFVERSPLRQSSQIYQSIPVFFIFLNVVLVLFWNEVSTRLDWNFIWSRAGWNEWKVQSTNAVKSLRLPKFTTPCCCRSKCDKEHRPLVLSPTSLPGHYSCVWRRNYSAKVDDGSGGGSFFIKRTGRKRLFFPSSQRLAEKWRVLDDDDLFPVLSVSVYYP